MGNEDIGLWCRIGHWRKWKKYWANPRTKELEEMLQNPKIMKALNSKFKNDRI